MSPAFWAEPVNAVTNLAFIIAGVLVVLAWHNSANKSEAALFLGIWVAVIGVGSFLLHTFATRWAALADTIPILVFILVYLYLALRHYLQLSLWTSLAITVIFIPVSAGAGAATAPLLGSSAGYASALLAIFVVGLLMLQRNRTIANGLLVSAGVFAVSIVFRTIDETLCPAVSLGTHFIWHLLNAVVLYLLSMIFMRQQDRAYNENRPDPIRPV